MVLPAAKAASTAAASVVSEKGLSWAGQAFFGSLCVGTFGLGVWQTRRYFEKVDIVAARQAALQQEPTTELPLSSSAADNNTANDTTVFRRIHLQGYFLHNYEFLVGPRGAPAGSLEEKRGASAATTTAAPSQQGYFVLTPFVVTNKIPASSSSLDKNETNSNNELVVIVNRGWVPRQMAVIPQTAASSSSYHNRQKQQDSAKNDDTTNDDKSESSVVAQHQQPRLSTVRRATVRRHDYLLQRTTDQQQSNNDLLYLNWERPVVPPLTKLTVVPAPHEKPRFIVPQHENVVQRQQQQHHHNQQQQQQHRTNTSSSSVILPPPPPKLFWFDRQAMKDIASSTLSPAQKKMPLLVLTAVKNDQHDNDKNEPASTPSSSASLWPAVPPASRVGEPKVTPMIHVGYAVTWYGLSAAGVYMTRKLITRGR